MNTKKSILTRKIKEKAKKIGFDLSGIAKYHPLKEESCRLRSYLQKGFQGEMHYLSNHFEKRVDPGQLMPGTKSIIVCILNYFSPHEQEDPRVPVLSKYAYGKDYHDVIKEKLSKLLNFMKDLKPGTRGRICVDSAPVLEKAWAVQAGLGWIGKNSLLLTEKYGSFVFIGEIITDMELEYDQEQVKDHCGKCTLCLEACPTRALVKPRVINASKCISYLTTSYKGEELSEEIKGKLANRMYGCDICQDVCPWNKNTKPHQTKEFEPIPGLLEKTGEDWEKLEEEEFEKLFHDSPVKRIKYKGLKRNIGFLK